MKKEQCLKCLCYSCKNQYSYNCYYFSIAMPVCDRCNYAPVITKCRNYKHKEE